MLTQRVRVLNSVPYCVRRYSTVETFGALVKQHDWPKAKLALENAPTDTLYSIQKFYSSSQEPKTLAIIHEVVTRRGLLLSERLCNLLLSNYCTRGQHDQAVAVFRSMSVQRCNIDNKVAANLMKLFGEKNIDLVLELQDKMYREKQFNPILHLLAIKYCTLSLRYSDAQRLCEKALEHKSEITINLWNTMLKCYFDNRNIDTALSIIDIMKTQKILFTEVTYSIIITGLVNSGKNSHAHKFLDELYRTNIEWSINLRNSVIKLYCAEGNISKAETIMSDVQDSVTTTVFIKGCINANQLESARAVASKLDYNRADTELFSVIVKLYCELGDYEKALQVIERMKQTRYKPTYVTYNSILNSYVERKMYNEAQNLFDQIAHHIVLWTTIVKMYCKQGDLNAAFQAVERMKKEGFKPNHVTFTVLLKACTEHGQYKHVHEIKRHLSEQDIPLELWSTLIKSACQEGDMNQAMEMVHTMQKHGHTIDSVLWNIILNGYVQAGEFSQVIDLFKKLNPTLLTVQIWSTVINALALSGNIETSLAYHDQMKHQGVEPSAVTYIILLSGCENERHYNSVLERLAVSHCQRSTTLYNTLISTHYKFNQPFKAINAFEEMETIGVARDIRTYKELLSDCASVHFIDRIEKEMMNKERTTFENSVLILILAERCQYDMAVQVFRSSDTTDILIWNSMFYTCVKAGFGSESLSLFQEMQKKRIRPNIETYIHVLSACSHSGLVQEAEHIYTLANKSNIAGEELAVSMVDVYARSGMLDQAESLARTVKKRKLPAWVTVLAGCKFYNDVQRMERLKHELPFLSERGSSMVLMANIFAQTGRMLERDTVRSSMDERNITKIPGVSYVKLQSGEVIRYTVDDESAPQEALDFIDDMYAVLKHQYKYEPDLSCVIKKFDTYEESVLHLHRHSEKLALGRAMLESGDHDILITKNLRICKDCHTFINFTAKHVNRTIKIKDASRYHVFTNGICSCKDFY
jgi:pentatricopeptide repeat protein